MLHFSADSHQCAQAGLPSGLHQKYTSHAVLHNLRVQKTALLCSYLSKSQ
eukprot:UN27997